jgi:hypothetical protein
VSQNYSDPRREGESHALPDIETFHVPDDYQPETDDGERLEDGWYWWSCFPGCLPDGEPIGPFETEEEALEDARSDLDIGDED